MTPPRPLLPLVSYRLGYRFTQQPSAPYPRYKSAMLIQPNGSIFHEKATTVTCFSCLAAQLGVPNGVFLPFELGNVRGYTECNIAIGGVKWGCAKRSKRSAVEPLWHDMKGLGRLIRMMRYCWAALRQVVHELYHPSHLVELLDNINWRMVGPFSVTVTGVVQYSSSFASRHLKGETYWVGPSDARVQFTTMCAPELADFTFTHGAASLYRNLFILACLGSLAGWLVGGAWG
ncbi:hypothetical protein F5888DRAFT_1637154 [Russula emetica]|nr:hypothetical protein F5888DRAFT_1637154 [Russula emetica]